MQGYEYWVLKSRGTLRFEWCASGSYQGGKIFGVIVCQNLKVGIKK